MSDRIALFIIRVIPFAPDSRQDTGVKPDSIPAGCGRMLSLCQVLLFWQGRVFLLNKDQFKDVVVLISHQVTCDGQAARIIKLI